MYTKDSVTYNIVLLSNRKMEPTKSIDMCDSRANYGSADFTKEDLVSQDDPYLHYYSLMIGSNRLWNVKTLLSPMLWH